MIPKYHHRNVSRDQIPFVAKGVFAVVAALLVEYNAAQVNQGF